MDDSPTKTFEEKLARLDQIVKELEGGSAKLQRMTELFREGKRLASECELQLKTSQEEVDKAMGPEPGA